MSEWAPLPACRSSPTPLPPVFTVWQLSGALLSVPARMRWLCVCLLCACAGAVLAAVMAICVREI